MNRCAAGLGLNSANSINVARLLAQVCYYFESVARLGGQAPVFCVPSGNFGNVTAGLIARSHGPAHAAHARRHQRQRHGAALPGRR